MDRDVSFWMVRHAPVEGASGTIWPVNAPANLIDQEAFGRVRMHLPRPAKVYASPAQRTIETAKALGLDPVLEPAFAEQDFGDWTGHRHEDLTATGGDTYARFWNNPAHMTPPGGESFADQITRVRRGLDRIAAGPVILVVHSGTIRAALAIALDIAPDAALRFVIDPLSLTRIDRLHDGWRVISVNQTWR
jgi:alpha-ribazole phosphatase